MRIFSGQRAFVVQRLTALVLLAYVVAFAIRLAFGVAPSYADWRAWASGAFGAAVVALLAVALLMHAWVGIRDVVLDYVKPLPVRLALLGAIAAGLVFLAAWVGFILMSHAL